MSNQAPSVTRSTSPITHSGTENNNAAICTSPAVTKVSTSSQSINTTASSLQARGLNSYGYFLPSQAMLSLTLPRSLSAPQSTQPYSAGIYRESAITTSTVSYPERVIFRPSTVPIAEGMAEATQTAISSTQQASQPRAALPQAPLMASPTITTKSTFNFYHNPLAAQLTAPLMPTSASAPPLMETMALPSFQYRPTTFSPQIQLPFPVSASSAKLSASPATQNFPQQVTQPLLVEHLHGAQTQPIQMPVPKVSLSLKQIPIAAYPAEPTNYHLYQQSGYPAFVYDPVIHAIFDQKLREELVTIRTAEELKRSSSLGLKLNYIEAKRLAEARLQGEFDRLALNPHSIIQYFQRYQSTIYTAPQAISALTAQVSPSLSSASFLPHSLPTQYPSARLTMLADESNAASPSIAPKITTKASTAVQTEASFLRDKAASLPLGFDVNSVLNVKLPQKIPENQPPKVLVNTKDQATSTDLLETTSDDLSLESAKAAISYIEMQNTSEDTEFTKTTQTDQPKTETKGIQFDRSVQTQAQTQIEQQPAASISQKQELTKPKEQIEIQAEQEKLQVSKQKKEEAAKDTKIEQQAPKQDISIRTAITEQPSAQMPRTSSITSSQTSTEQEISNAFATEVRIPFTLSGDYFLVDKSYQSKLQPNNTFEAQRYFDMPPSVYIADPRDNTKGAFSPVMRDKDGATAKERHVKYQSVVDLSKELLALTDPVARIKKLTEYHQLEKDDKPQPAAWVDAILMGFPYAKKDANGIYRPVGVMDKNREKALTNLIQLVIKAPNQEQRIELLKLYRTGEILEEYPPEQPDYLREAQLYFEAPNFFEFEGETNLITPVGDWTSTERGAFEDLALELESKEDTPEQRITYLTAKAMKVKVEDLVIPEQPKWRELLQTAIGMAVPFFEKQNPANADSAWIPLSTSDRITNALITMAQKMDEEYKASTAEERALSFDTMKAIFVDSGIFAPLRTEETAGVKTAQAIQIDKEIESAKKDSKKVKTPEQSLPFRAVPSQLSSSEESITAPNRDSTENQPSRQSIEQETADPLPLATEKAINADSTTENQTKVSGEQEPPPPPKPIDSITLPADGAITAPEPEQWVQLRKLGLNLPELQQENGQWQISSDYQEGAGKLPKALLLELLKELENKMPDQVLGTAMRFGIRPDPKTMELQKTAPAIYQQSLQQAHLGTALWWWQEAQELIQEETGETIALHNKDNSFQKTTGHKHFDSIIDALLEWPNLNSEDRREMAQAVLANLRNEGVISAIEPKEIRDSSDEDDQDNLSKEQLKSANSTLSSSVANSDPSSEDSSDSSDSSDTDDDSKKPELAASVDKISKQDSPQSDTGSFSVSDKSLTPSDSIATVKEPWLNGANPALVALVATLKTDTSIVHQKSKSQPAATFEARRYFAMPNFTYIETKDADGNTQGKLTPYVTEENGPQGETAEQRVARANAVNRLSTELGNINTPFERNLYLIHHHALLAAKDIPEQPEFWHMPLKMGFPFIKQNEHGIYQPVGNMSEKRQQVLAELIEQVKAASNEAQLTTLLSEFRETELAEDLLPSQENYPFLAEVQHFFGIPLFFETSEDNVRPLGDWSSKETDILEELFNELEQNEGSSKQAIEERIKLCTLKTKQRKEPDYQLPAQPAWRDELRQLSKLGLPYFDKRKSDSDKATADWHPIAVPDKELATSLAQFAMAMDALYHKEPNTSSFAHQLELKNIVEKYSLPLQLDTEIQAQIAIEKRNTKPTPTPRASSQSNSVDDIGPAKNSSLQNQEPSQWQQLRELGLKLPQLIFKDGKAQLPDDYQKVQTDEMRFSKELLTALLVDIEGKNKNELLSVAMEYSIRPDPELAKETEDSPRVQNMWHAIYKGNFVYYWKEAASILHQETGKEFYLQIDPNSFKSTTGNAEYDEVLNILKNHPHADSTARKQLVITKLAELRAEKRIPNPISAEDPSPPPPSVPKLNLPDDATLHPEPEQWKQLRTLGLDLPQLYLVNGKWTLSADYQDQQGALTKDLLVELLGEIENKSQEQILSLAMRFGIRPAAEVINLKEKNPALYDRKIQEAHLGNALWWWSEAYFAIEESSGESCNLTNKENSWQKTTQNPHFEKILEALLAEPNADAERRRNIAVQLLTAFISEGVITAKNKGGDQDEDGAPDPSLPNKPSPSKTAKEEPSTKQPEPAKDIKSPFAQKTEDLAPLQHTELENITALVNTLKTDTSIKLQKSKSQPENTFEARRYFGMPNFTYIESKDEQGKTVGKLTPYVTAENGPEGETNEQRLLRANAVNSLSVVLGNIDTPFERNLHLLLHHDLLEADGIPKQPEFWYIGLKMGFPFIKQNEQGIYQPIGAMSSKRKLVLAELIAQVKAATNEDQVKALLDEFRETELTEDLLPSQEDFPFLTEVQHFFGIPLFFETSQENIRPLGDWTSKEVEILERLFNDLEDKQGTSKKDIEARIKLCTLKTKERKDPNYRLPSQPLWREEVRQMSQLGLPYFDKKESDTDRATTDWHPIAVPDKELAKSLSQLAAEMDNLFAGTDNKETAEYQAKRKAMLIKYEIKLSSISEPKASNPKIASVLAQWKRLTDLGILLPKLEMQNNELTISADYEDQPLNRPNKKLVTELLENIKASNLEGDKLLSLAMELGIYPDPEKDERNKISFDAMMKMCNSGNNIYWFLQAKQEIEKSFPKESAYLVRMPNSERRTAKDAKFAELIKSLVNEPYAGAERRSEIVSAYLAKLKTAELNLKAPSKKASKEFNYLLEINPDETSEDDQESVSGSYDVTNPNVMTSASVTNPLPEPSQMEIFTSELLNPNLASTGASLLDNTGDLDLSLVKPSGSKIQLLDLPLPPEDETVTLKPTKITPATTTFTYIPEKDGMRSKKQASEGVNLIPSLAFSQKIPPEKDLLHVSPKKEMAQSIDVKVNVNANANLKGDKKVTLDKTASLQQEQATQREHQKPVERLFDRANVDSDTKKAIAKKGLEENDPVRTQNVISSTAPLAAGEPDPIKPVTSVSKTPSNIQASNQPAGWKILRQSGLVLPNIKIDTEAETGLPIFTLTEDYLDNRRSNLSSELLSELMKNVAHLIDTDSVYKAAMGYGVIADPSKQDKAEKEAEIAKANKGKATFWWDQITPLLTDLGENPNLKRNNDQLWVSENDKLEELLPALQNMALSAEERTRVATAYIEKTLNKSPQAS